MVVREGFSARLPFLLAAVAAILGLGALARFPHLRALDGSGFLILYACAWLVVALPLLMAEFALGHGRPRNVVDAYANSAPWGWGWAGRIQVVGALLAGALLAGVGGWTSRYAFASFTAPWHEDPAGFFARVQEGPDALFAALGFLVVAVLLSVRGLRRGLVTVAFVAVPVGVVAAVSLATYANFQDGADQAWSGYLAPNFGSLRAADGTHALQAALLAIGLGTGTMATLASAHHDPLRIARKATNLAILAVGFVATLALFIAPLVLGGPGEAAGKAAGATDPTGLFVAATQGFASVGGTAGGILAGTLYASALLLLLAASVALLEVPVGYLLDRYDTWRRWRAALFSGLAVLAVTLPFTIEADRLLDLERFLVGVLGPLAGILLSVRVAWIQPVLLDTFRLEGRSLRPLMRPLIGFAVPAACAALLVVGSAAFLAGTGLVERGAGGLWRLVP